MTRFPINLDPEALADFLEEVEPANLFFTDMVPGDQWSEDPQQDD